MEGEVRRIHIIYFLSRKGRIEHPHLVRVHHFSQNGVHLRDVKRWLAELRGKDMPELFAWSYKRRYRTGYVWQDLVDEDLITPISDNEFVLKGSEIHSNNNTNSTDANAEKRVYMQESFEREEIAVDQNISSLEEIQQNQQTTICISPKTSPSFSPEASTLTENSINLEERKLLETNKQDNTKEPKVDEPEINSLFVNPARVDENNQKKKKKDGKKKRKNEKGNLANSIGLPSLKPKQSFGVIRKLFSCRATETKESTMVKLNKRKCDKELCTNNGNNIVQDENSSESFNTAETSKEENNGGSERLLNSWKQQKCPSARRSHDGVKRSNSTRSQSKSPKPHKPFNGPNCSQCGKMFKPEKMHKHMSSCSARRSFGKGSGVFAASTTASTDHDLSSRSMDYSTSQELLSGYYLNYRNRE